MRSLFDYMFVKLYQWFEYLNRINRKYGIAWEEDSLWSAIFGLSVLQSILFVSATLWLFYFLEYDKLLIVLRTTVSEEIYSVIYLALFILPMVICYYRNKLYYKDVHLKKIMCLYKKSSNTSAIVLFVATWLVYLFSAIYTKGD